MTDRALARRASPLVVAGVALLMALAAGAALAQDTAPVYGAPNAAADVNIDSRADVKNDAMSQSGGNVFDFSSGGGRNTPPAPSVGAFGGASCVGAGTAVSGSAPGFSVGYGRSYEDEACQRRNWVQTLLGTAQHMPEEEAAALKRVALELMMQDEYVGPAFEALGFESAIKRQEREAEARQDAAAGRAATRAPGVAPQRERPVGQMARGCTVVVPSGAPAAMTSLLSAQNCRVIQ